MNNEMMKWGTLAQTFLASAKFQAKRIAEEGNKNVVISEKPLPEDEYDAITEANDRNLAVPTIYSFYHGIELLLKGALSSVGALGKKNHDLGVLFENFKNSFSNQTELIQTLDSVLSPNAMSPNNPVKNFCDTNEITPAQFYEALRYPESRGGVAFGHGALKYNEEEGADYFGEMCTNIDELMAGFVKI